MLKIKKKLILINIIFLLCLFSSGCKQVDNMQVKLGLKNRDFEYIKNGKIRKIVIQNTRDKGFRFVISDERAILELYDILSSAKIVSQKTTLHPDYIFEMDDGSNKKYTFNYVTGIGNKGNGNLYSDNKVYYVSKRLDNDIIKNFWEIKSPKNFKEVYYKSIINVLKDYTKDIDESKKIGINLNNDVEVAKFILSIDVEDFKMSLKNNFKNVEIIEDLNKAYDVVVNVETDGYSKNYAKEKEYATYKCSMTVNDFKDKNEKKYYVWDKYSNGQWVFEFFKDKKPPKY